MGWFWANAQPSAGPQQLPPGHPPLPHDAEAPHSACPVRHQTVAALTPLPDPRPEATRSTPTTSGCPVPHDQRGGKPSNNEGGLLSKLNPLNYMFRDISQAPAPHQTYKLPTEREESSIPKGSGEGGNWEYPSPQQMYNALLRKGYTDTDVTAVESMVAVHNFLNEGAWDEILGWEKRFAGGLMRGAKICTWGENNVDEVLYMYPLSAQDEPAETQLARFQGRPKELTPKAMFLQALGYVLPEKFGGEPPFDRHDWYVTRTINGKEELVRYVIDYYSGPYENGQPVFFLDVRPAATPRGTMERVVRWSGEMWWKATGGVARHSPPRTDDGGVD